MSAYTRQQKAMKRLGIIELKRVEIVGSVSVWNARLDNGDIVTVNEHKFASETGALRKLAHMLKPITIVA